MPGVRAFFRAFPAARRIRHHHWAVGRGLLCKRYLEISCGISKPGTSLLTTRRVPVVAAAAAASSGRPTSGQLSSSFVITASAAQRLLPSGQSKQPGCWLRPMRRIFAFASVLPSAKRSEVHQLSSCCCLFYAAALSSGSARILGIVRLSCAGGGAIVCCYCGCCCDPNPAKYILPPLYDDSKRHGYVQIRGQLPLPSEKRRRRACGTKTRQPRPSPRPAAAASSHRRQQPARPIHCAYAQSTGLAPHSRTPRSSPARPSQQRRRRCRVVALCCTAASGAPETQASCGAEMRRGFQM